MSNVLDGGVIKRALAADALRQLADRIENQDALLVTQLEHQRWPMGSRVIENTLTVKWRAR